MFVIQGYCTVENNAQMGPTTALEKSTSTTGESTEESTEPEEIRDLPVCPAFKEIGEKFGEFDFGMIPIG